jgi:hypothetical protein
VSSPGQGRRQATPIPASAERAPGPDAAPGCTVDKRRDEDARLLRSITAKFAALPVSGRLQIRNEDTSRNADERR